MLDQGILSVFVEATLLILAVSLVYGTYIYPTEIDPRIVTQGYVQEFEFSRNFYVCPVYLTFKNLGADGEVVTDVWLINQVTNAVRGYQRIGVHLDWGEINSYKIKFDCEKGNDYQVQTSIIKSSKDSVGIVKHIKVGFSKGISRLF